MHKFVTKYNANSSKIKNILLWYSFLSKVVYFLEDKADA